MALITSKTPTEILQQRVVSSIARAVQAQRRAIQDIARLVADQDEVVAVEYAPATEDTPEVAAVEGQSKLEVFEAALGEEYLIDVQVAVAAMVANVNDTSDNVVSNPLEG